MSSREVNLHQVDGDPRKMIAVRQLVEDYPEAIEYWHNSGILERTSVSKPVNNHEVYKHKHGVLGHQFGGAVYAREITGLLVDKQILTEADARETVLANLIHDADKPTDMALIVMAMGGKEGNQEVNWNKVEDIVRKTDLPNKDDVLAELKDDYAGYFKNNVRVGERVHVARALIAGRVHKERLARAGFSEAVIDIQSATEYTGCDEMDYLIDNYGALSPDEQTRTVQKSVVNYVDNGMKESELVPVEERCAAVFAKPINIELSKDYREWNEKGETAEDKQNRVGKKVERFLAKLTGIDPEHFLHELEARVQKRLSSV